MKYQSGPYQKYQRPSSASFLFLFIITSFCLYLWSCRISNKSPTETSRSWTFTRLRAAIRLKPVRTYTHPRRHKRTCCLLAPNDHGHYCITVAPQHLTETTPQELDGNKQELSVAQMAWRWWRRGAGGSIRASYFDSEFDGQTEPAVRRIREPNTLHIKFKDSENVPQISIFNWLKCQTFFINE